MASITQDMKYRLSLINTPKGMVSQKLLSNTKPTGSIFIVGNVVMTVLLNLCANFPDALIITQISIRPKKSSLSTTCTDVILMPVWLSFG